MMTKRKAKKQDDEERAKDQYKWEAMKAIAERQAAVVWWTSIYLPVIPPGIARWFKSS